MKRSSLILTATMLAALGSIPVLAGPAENARADKSFDALIHCQVLAAGALDDGVSAADKIAIAAIEECQDEAVYAIVDFERTKKVKFSQEEINYILLNMRNDLTHSVLTIRAKRRVGSVVNSPL